MVCSETRRDLEGMDFVGDELLVASPVDWFDAPFRSTDPFDPYWASSRCCVYTEYCCWMTSFACRVPPPLITSTLSVAR